jgi:hypothetical protein
MIVASIIVALEILMPVVRRSSLTAFNRVLHAAQLKPLLRLPQRTGIPGTFRDSCRLWITCSRCGTTFITAYRSGESGLRVLGWLLFRNSITVDVISSLWPTNMWPPVG